MSIAVTSAALRRRAPTGAVLAQLRPSRSDRLLGHGAVVGELHHQHPHRGPNWLRQPANSSRMRSRYPGMPTSLSPWYQAAPRSREVSERGDHPVVHHADSGVGVPRRARAASLDLADRIAPPFAERDPLAAADGEGRPCRRRW
jgi:hypothetical protein